MTEYNEYYDGHVTNPSHTVGLMNLDEFKGKQIEWHGKYTPKLLREWADLIEFCYGNETSIQFGTLTAIDDNELNHERAPCLLFGNPDDDKVCSIAPRKGNDE